MFFIYLYAAGNYSNHQAQQQIAGQAFHADDNFGDCRLGNQMPVSNGGHCNNAEVKRVDDGIYSASEVKRVRCVEILVDCVDG